MKGIERLRKRGVDPAAVEALLDTVAEDIVLLAGSYATGEHNPTSDLDLLIITDGRAPTRLPDMTNHPSILGDSFDGMAGDLAANGDAVDPAPVAAIAEELLRAKVQPGHQLVADSIDVKVGKPLVTGQAISFPASAIAQQIYVRDPDKARPLFLGKDAGDARQALAP